MKGMRKEGMSSLDKKVAPSYNDTVVIRKGLHKGRIGIYDDDDDCDKTIVYCGEVPLCMIAGEYFIIPKNYLSIATIFDLIVRKQAIEKNLFQITKRRSRNDKKITELLFEYNLITTSLYERDREMRHAIHKEGNKKIFIAHSSKDKNLARRITNDLKNIYKFDPWFDEIKIKPGESIPAKIQEGLHNCDYMLVLLSEDSVKSNWMKTEYSSKLWDEIEQERIYVIPLLINTCEIPQLLKHKKYINFVNQDYLDALNDVVDSVY